MIYLIFWGVIFVVTVIAELATLQLISIWFAVGAAGIGFCDGKSVASGLG